MNTSTTTSLKHSSRVRGSIAIILIGGMAVLLSIFAAGVLLYSRIDTLILPGVQFRGLDLGGMDQVQAAQAINAAWNEHRAVEISDGKRTWSTPMESLGLKLDPHAMSSTAFKIGREPFDFQLIYRHLRGETREIEPVVVLNAQNANAYLNKWASMINQPAEDAQLEYHQGQVEMTTSRSGETLDMDEAMADLQADPAGVFFSARFKISFNPVMPQVSDLSQVNEQIQALRATRLGGIIYDPISDERIPWEISQKTIDSWIIVRHNVDGGYEVSFNQNSLVEYLQGLERKLDLGEGRVLIPIQKPQELAEQMLEGYKPVLLVRHLPSEYTAQGGESMLSVAWQTGIPMWRLIDANPNVNQRWIPAGTHLVIPSPDDLLPYPVVLNKRIVISIAEQHMWVTQDGEQIRDFVISTGIPDSPTQPGIYQVQTHDLNAYADNWDLWMPHWLGIYEAWPGFMNGIHGLPMLSNGVRLWKNILGSPASYGCIILDLPEAEWLYNWAENGVVVEIRR